ncbi:MAG: hypothetical protein E6R03_15010 [Hyphomicrobiaceae bacterium]|nr:MAG: hypothetical protein E6R03_15010 [Hyphomicrobiaceae bacterium]
MTKKAWIWTGLSLTNFCLLFLSLAIANDSVDRHTIMLFIGLNVIAIGCAVIGWASHNPSVDDAVQRTKELYEGTWITPDAKDKLLCTIAALNREKIELGGIVSNLRSQLRDARDAQETAERLQRIANEVAQYCMDTVANLPNLSPQTKNIDIRT